MLFIKQTQSEMVSAGVFFLFLFFLHQATSLPMDDMDEYMTIKRLVFL